MAVQDLAFRSDARPRDYVTKDRAYTLSCRAYSDGTQEVPSAATISIKRPGGEALPTPVSAAAMTVDGSGTMTYALVAGNTSLLAANYTADVAYTVSGTVRDANFVFDVCRRPPRNVVIQADLVFHHVDLTDLLTGAESNTQAYIRQSYEDLLVFLDGKSIRPYLVLNAEVMRRSIEHRALELFFFSKKKNDEDRWAALERSHGQAYHTERDTLGERLIFDQDQSLTADGTATEGASGEEGSVRTNARYSV